MSSGSGAAAQAGPAARNGNIINAIDSFFIEDLPSGDTGHHPHRRGRAKTMPECAKVKMMYLLMLKIAVLIFALFFARIFNAS